MPGKLQRQLVALQDVLANYPTPQSEEETFRLTVKALQRALGKVRILFYMLQYLPTCDFLSLVPCSARQFDSDVFIHDSSNQSLRFRFETKQPLYVPLIASSHTSGLMFIEKLKAPLDESDRSLVALVASQMAHFLARLPDRYREIEASGSRFLRIDSRRRQVWINNVSVHLTAKEFTTFELLYRNRGQTCSRYLICQTVYFKEVVSIKYRQDRLDKVLYKLRKKLTQIEGNPITIETVRGLGYRLELTLAK